jgi:hypothetical protein
MSSLGGPPSRNISGTLPAKRAEYRLPRQVNDRRLPNLLSGRGRRFFFLAERFDHPPRWRRSGLPAFRTIDNRSGRCTLKMRVLTRSLVFHSLHRKRKP